MRGGKWLATEEEIGENAGMEFSPWLGSFPTPEMAGWGFLVLIALVLLIVGWLGGLGAVASKDISEEYWPPLGFAVLCQVGVGLLLLLPYHMGQLVMLWVISGLTFWMVVGFMLWMRPAQPTAGDLHFARWGFLLFFVVAGPLFSWWLLPD